MTPTQRCTALRTAEKTKQSSANAIRNNKKDLRLKHSVSDCENQKAATGLPAP